MIPDTLQLVNSILATISESNKVISSKSVHFTDYSDMWDITSFAENEYVFLTTGNLKQVE